MSTCVRCQRTQVFWARNGLFAVFTLLGEQDARLQRARADLPKIAS